MQNKVGEIILPAFKVYYCTTVYSNWLKGRIEIPEIYPYIKGQLIFDNVEDVKDMELLHTSGRNMNAMTAMENSCTFF